VPVGPAKFDPNRCNESPLRGEKPDFWPVSKNNTGSLPLRGILPVNSTINAKIRRKSFSHIGTKSLELSTPRHETGTVASEAICKGGTMPAQSAGRKFFDVPLTFLLCPHMRGHNDCVLPTEKW